MKVSGFENIAGAIGNLGGVDQISQRVYGPIEKGMHNRPKYGRLTTPDVYMAPYPYTPPGETPEFFPLGGNSRTGFRFEAGLPSRSEMLLAQSSPGGQNIGNVGGMMQPPQEFIPMEGFEGYGSPQPTGPSPDQLKALQTYDNAKQKKDAQNAALLRQGIEARNQMLEASPVSRKPVYLDINAVPQGLESIGAGARLDLGRNQNLNFGGMFTPGYTEQGVEIPQGYTLKAGYGTPSLDVNVNFREGRRGLGPQQGGGFGAEAMYNTRF
jgi:hypothetical protein